MEVKAAKWLPREEATGGAAHSGAHMRGGAALPLFHLVQFLTVKTCRNGVGARKQPIAVKWEPVTLPHSGNS